MDKPFEKILKKLDSYAKNDSPILAKIREEIKKATETVETSENQLENIKAIIGEAENKLEPLKSGVADATEYFEAGLNKLDINMLKEIGFEYSPEEIKNNFKEKSTKKIAEYTDLITDKNNEIKELETSKKTAEIEITELSELLEDKIKEQQSLSELFEKVGTLDSLSDTKSIISMFVKNEGKEGLSLEEADYATELFMFPQNHSEIWKEIKGSELKDDNIENKVSEDENSDIKEVETDKLEDKTTEFNTDLYDFSALFGEKKSGEEPVIKEEKNIIDEKASLIKHLESRGIIISAETKSEIVANLDEINLSLVDKIIELFQTKGNKRIEDISLVIGAILKINKLSVQDIVQEISPEASIADIVFSLIQKQNNIFNVKDDSKSINEEKNENDQDDFNITNLDEYFNQFIVNNEPENIGRKFAA